MKTSAARRLLDLFRKARRDRLRKKPLARYRPCLERLEDRWVPAGTKPSVTLDQWADGQAPDSIVSSGSQKDQWQNGNLGASQAHYGEGESVPYRAVMQNLTEGNTYYLQIEWDTTQSGKHALDYITTWNRSFP